jgi:hypothetical protein
MDVSVASRDKEAAMKKMLILLPFILALMLGSMSCGNSEVVYEEGYVDGYEEGYLDGYMVGYEEGLQAFQPEGEVINILSYNLERDISGWVDVMGEVQNLSNNGVNVTVQCALVDSAGQIVRTSDVYMLYIAPQGTTFFTIEFNACVPEAVDARFILTEH